VLRQTCLHGNLAMRWAMELPEPQSAQGPEQAAQGAPGQAQPGAVG
jgi:hypothetical protein